MKSFYFIGEFSEMTGIPIRTLHYYDEAGLLKPNRRPNGRRSYTLDDMVKLQKILSLKSLGFSLAQISELLKLPKYDQSLVEMLQLQQQSLQIKRDQIEESLDLISRIMTVIQSEEHLEHQLLFNLIRNMSQENMQREWVANHLSKQTAEKLFGRSKSELEEMDAETVRFFRDVKRLSTAAENTEEAETVIGTYVKWVLTFLDQKAMDNFRNLDEDEQKKLAQLVDMPFNEAEIAWLDRALEHYFSKYPLERDFM